MIERNWRITLLMTNGTRKPAAVPVLSSRAVVIAGRKQYAGTVYLEREARELNPGDALVVWVLVRLGRDDPRFVQLEASTEARVRVLARRSRTLASAALPANRHVASPTSGRKR